MSKIEDNILEVSSVISNAVELLYKANGSSEFNSSTIALRIIKKDNNTAKLYYYSTNGTPVIIG